MTWRDVTAEWMNDSDDCLEDFLERRFPQGPPCAEPAKPSALAEQVGGSHYKGFKIQPVEFTQVNKIPPIEAAVIWYLCRHKAKNGIEDIRKSIHFLRMLAELEYGVTL